MKHYSMLMQFFVIGAALLGFFYFDEIPFELQVMGSRIIMLLDCRESQF